MQFDIDFDMAALKDVKAMVSGIKNGYKKAVVTAINKTVATTKVQAKARIGNELNLKASRIEKDLSVQKANYSKISGAVIAKGEPVGLINFSARQTQKGTSIKVLRSSPRTLLKHAYIATGRGTSTKEHVFWRKTRMLGKKFPVGKISKAAWPKLPEKFRMPAERLTGPRIEDIFAKTKVISPLTIQANFLLLKNTDIAVTKIIQGYAHG